MKVLRTLSCLVVIFALSALMAADPKSPVVVRVKGVSITRADLLFLASQEGISEEDLPDQEAKLIEILIERQLMRSFLESKKIEPNAEELHFQIGTAEEYIRKRGEDPQKFLAKLGYTPDRMKRELGLPLAFKVYANQTITNQHVKDYFNQHKQELDGTQLRARQIFLKLPKAPTEAEIDAKKAELKALRDDILAGKVKFEDAAKTHSEAPSREQGGDLELFGWRGKLPAEVTRAAFALKVGEISDPVISRFGAHLIMVTERHPGDFSLEDVRRVIFDELSQDLWKTTVAKELKTAKIERPGNKKP